MVDGKGTIQTKVGVVGKVHHCASIGGGPMIDMKAIVFEPISDGHFQISRVTFLKVPAMV